MRDNRPIVSMRFLLLTQYYPPEPGAAQNRLRSFVRGCRARGIDVTVLTALPNYPQGRVYKEYRGQCVVRETLDDAEIIRVWIYPRPGLSWAGRGMMYMSFALSALIAGLWNTTAFDILIWESPPLVLGPTAFLLSRAKRARLVTNISDLWTSSLLGLGLVSEGMLSRSMAAVERFLYRNSDLVTGQTQYIIDEIRRDTANTEVVLWRNGADRTQANEGSVAETRASWGLSPEHFVAGYAGVFGISQGLEVICRAAALVRLPQVRFVMVGDGAMRPQIEDLARSLKLSNLVFVPRQPHHAMPSVWGAFDSAIVSLKRSPVFEGAVPSKMFEAMYARRPVVLAVDGEAADILQAANAGITIEPENPQALAKAIEDLAADEGHRRVLGENGHRAVTTDFDRATLNDRIIDRLISLAGPES